MKQIKFNPNDPKLWKNYDPNEKSEAFVGNKDETAIKRQRSLRLAYENIELREKQSDLRKGKPITPEHTENIRKARLEAPKRTEKTKEKIGKSQLGNGKHNKPCVVPGGVFHSRKAAADWATSHGASNTVNRLELLFKKYPDKFYYITKEQYQDLSKDCVFDPNQEWITVKDKKKKAVFTPEGIFESATECCQHYKKSLGWLKDKMKRHPEEYFYIV